MNLEISSAQPLNPRAIACRWVPVNLAAAEADLVSRFLGDDLDAICGAAAAAGDAVFIATAGLPLARRKEALKSWRKRTAARLISAVPEIRAFCDSAPPEIRERVLAGEIGLVELDEMAAAAAAATSQRKMAALSASKTRLALAVRDVLADCSPDDEGPIVPGCLVILESGECRVFRRRHSAVEFARAAGVRYLLAEVDREKISNNPGPEVG